MIAPYDERLLRTLVDDRVAAAGATRLGQAERRLRRAVQAAAAAHRKAVRADLRAVRAQAVLSSSVLPSGRSGSLPSGGLVGRALGRRLLGAR